MLAKSGSYSFEEFDESTSFRALHKYNLGICYGTGTQKILNYALSLIGMSD